VLWTICNHDVRACLCRRFRPGNWTRKRQKMNSIEYWTAAREHIPF